MKNYKYVLEYDSSAFIDPKNIYDALSYAWKVTPSKQNFMPYKVHVLTPAATTHKQILYNKALTQQAKTSNIKIKNSKDLQKYDEHLKKTDQQPFFRNLKTAPYVFLFAQRVEDQPNSFQQRYIDYGRTYCQVERSEPGHSHGKSIARIEIGMFSANLATQLLANDIDVSFTQCFPGELNAWTEKEFDFLADDVLLIMTAGKGNIYRRELKSQEGDLKPSFNRIVNKEV